MNLQQVYDKLQMIAEQKVIACVSQMDGVGENLTAATTFLTQMKLKRDLAITDCLTLLTDLFPAPMTSFMQFVQGKLELPLALPTIPALPPLPPVVENALEQISTICGQGGGFGSPAALVAEMASAATQGGDAIAGVMDFGKLGKAAGQQMLKKMGVADVLVKSVGSNLPGFGNGVQGITDQLFAGTKPQDLLDVANGYGRSMLNDFVRKEGLTRLPTGSQDVVDMVMGNIGVNGRLSTEGLLQAVIDEVIDHITPSVPYTQSSLTAGGVVSADYGSVVAAGASGATQARDAAVTAGATTEASDLIYDAITAADADARQALIDAGVPAPQADVLVDDCRGIAFNAAGILNSEGIGGSVDGTSEPLS